MTDIELSQSKFKICYSSFMEKAEQHEFELVDPNNGKFDILKAENDDEANFRRFVALVP